MESLLWSFQKTPKFIRLVEDHRSHSSSTSSTSLMKILLLDLQPTSQHQTHWSEKNFVKICFQIKLYFLQMGDVDLHLWLHDCDSCWATSEYFLRGLTLWRRIFLALEVQMSVCLCVCVCVRHTCYSCTELLQDFWRTSEGLLKDF